MGNSDDNISKCPVTGAIGKCNGRLYNPFM